MAHAAKAMIGISLATVAASVKNLEVFKPAIFIKLSKTIKVIGLVRRVKAGNDRRVRQSRQPLLTDDGCIGLESLH